MKKLCFALLSALLLFAAAPAAAQWQTPNHSVPIGKGGGNTGFSSAAPGTAGRPLVSNGASSDPAFGTIGNAGFTPGAANTVKGSLNGTTTSDIAVPNCTSASQALQWTAGVGPSCGTLLTLTGYDMPINMGLTSTVVGNALTINLTTAAGAVPSGSSPVLIPFRSLTAASGLISWSTVSAATSITVPSTATLGTSSSNVPFRIWIFALANGGTPAIGVAVCSNSTALFPCASWEYTLKTTTAISAAANSSGVLYATAGVTADAVRIIGFCDYSGGLTTAGAWASACTTLQVFGPGVKKPGEIVQLAPYAIDSGTTSCVSVGFTTQTSLSASITPSSSMNFVEAVAQLSGTANGTSILSFQLSRGTGPTLIGGILAFGLSGGGAPASTMGGALQVLDKPNTASSVTYPVFCKGSGGGGTYNSGGGTSTISLKEIMG